MRDGAVGVGSLEVDAEGRVGGSVADAQGAEALAVALKGYFKGRSAANEVVEDVTPAGGVSLRISPSRRQEAYLDSVRQTEKNLVRAGAWLDRPKPRVRVSSPGDIRDKGRIEERIRLMFDLIPLILETDSSRLINMGIQVDHGVINMNGVNESHHNLSHHGQDPTKIKKLIKVESAILSQFKKLLDQLKTTKVAGGALLDHTTVLCGSNLGNANNHNYRNLPIIVAGGGYNHGQFVTYNRQDNLPLSNLFLSLLNNIGIETPAFGASNGALVWG